MMMTSQDDDEVTSNSQIVNAQKMAHEVLFQYQTTRIRTFMPSYKRFDVISLL